MKSYMRDEDAKELLEFLQRIDDGYVPTEKEVQDMNEIRVVNFFGMNLTNLPDSIGRLSQLTVLRTHNNLLTDLPESIGNLYQLNELDVCENNLKYLPECIGNLSKLTDLNVSYNQLTNLPESIGNLSKLTNLSLSQNQLTNLPEHIRNLPNLSSLNIIGNQFTKLPKWLCEIKSLTDFQLGGNPITTLPLWLGDMKQMTSIGLSGLNLEEVPPWIHWLPKLKELNIAFNPMKELPDWLGDMTTLKELSLYGLSLTKIPSSLIKLGLPFFADISAWMDNKFVGINIDGTELSIQPVSLFDQSRDRSENFHESRKLIEDYFETPKIHVREAKVIFLGDGKVGKTYTIQRLLNNCEKGDYPTKETHGILIEDLHTVKDGNDYTVRVWDFGGQDIMHEMHRCFLTDRTCYIVMVDTRTDKQTGRARYWLRTVQSVAPKAPVLLLVNEISGSQNRDLDYKSLEQDFPNLVGVRYCSSLDASDEEFRQQVENTIFEQALNLDSCKMELPISWENVRKSLLDQRDEAAYYIDRNTFHDICNQHGVSADDGLRAWLLTWFNDLGVCFSYHLNDKGQEESNDYKILDPMWLTSAVYKIIWEKERTDDGLISKSEIYRILKTPGSDAMKKNGIPCLENVFYNESECGYVLDIMRKFCISYPAGNGMEFMPTLCKTDSKLDPTPQTWKQHAAYLFRYTFLPESVLHRLMISCFANLRSGKRWRKGFWLECESQGLSAVIRTIGRDSEENELQIDVYAQKEQHEAWTWLQPICQEIMKINDTLSLKPDAYVLAENGNEKEWFLLDKVWYWKRQGTLSLQGDKSLFSIQSLMTTIYGKYYPSVEEKVMETQDQRPVLMSETLLIRNVTEEIVNLIGLDLRKPFGEQFFNEWKRSNDLKELEIEAIDRNTYATLENTEVEQMNTFALQQSNELLQAIRDGRVDLPTELITVLSKKLRQSDNPELNAAGQKMKWYFWKDKGKLLRDLLGDAANIATIAPIMVNLGATYGPMLMDVLRNL